LRSILLTGFLFIVGFAGSTSSVHAQLLGYNPSDSADMKALDISAIQLIANPKTYNGKKVRVIGFVRLEFEGNAVYLHREDYENGLMKNAIRIHPPDDITKAQVGVINNHYAICEGTFHTGWNDHKGLFTGAIDHITRLQQWPHWQQ
jgi:hypothetical protein